MKQPFLPFVLPALLALAACGGSADAPVDETATADETADAGEAASGDEATREWLLGTWVFAETCATDNSLTFEADGTLSGSTVRGSYTYQDGVVEERLTHEIVLGEDGETVLDPPMISSYRVTRLDDDHAQLEFETGESVTILRCG